MWLWQDEDGGWDRLLEEHTDMGQVQELPQSMSPEEVANVEAVEYVKHTGGGGGRRGWAGRGRGPGAPPIKNANDVPLSACAHAVSAVDEPKWPATGSGKLLHIL